MKGTCNSFYLGGWGRRIAWTQRVEIAVSQDPAIALQPGQQGQKLHKKKKTKEEEEEEEEEKDWLTAGKKCKNTIFL